LKWYICAIEDGASKPPSSSCMVRTKEELDAFAARHDRPGLSVYWCPNPLRDDAETRCLDTLEQVDVVWWDSDTRALDATQDQIDQRLQHLPEEPTDVRNSGGGRHLEYRLKEPISATDAKEFARVRQLYKDVARMLSCDPAPAHPAALQRYPGSTNYKYGVPIKVGTVWGSLTPVDITDLEAMRDLLPEDGIIPRKAKANGHAVEKPSGPVGDVELELASMRPGDGSVNEVQTRVITSLIMRAENPNEIVDRVVEGTMKMAAEHAPDWKERDEYAAVIARVKTQLAFVAKEYDCRTGESRPGYALTFTRRGLRLSQRVNGLRSVETSTAFMCVALMFGTRNKIPTHLALASPGFALFDFQT
jgi:hypothetical protein